MRGDLVNLVEQAILNEAFDTLTQNLKKNIDSKRAEDMLSEHPSPDTIRFIRKVLQSSFKATPIKFNNNKDQLAIIVYFIKAIIYAMPKTASEKPDVIKSKYDQIIDKFLDNAEKILLNSDNFKDYTAGSMDVASVARSIKSLSSSWIGKEDVFAA
jgi:hypothetical protein